MSDKPFLGLVVPFVPAVGWIRAYKAKEFPSDLVAIDVTAGGCYAGWRGPSKLIPAHRTIDFREISAFSLVGTTRSADGGEIEV